MPLFSKHSRPSQNLFRASLLRKEKPIVTKRRPEKKEGIFEATLPFGWLIFLFVVGYALFFSPWLRITEVKIVGETIVPRTTLETAVKAELAGNYFHLFSRANLLLVPKNEIGERLIAEYPKFKAVRVLPIFPHGLKVEISEKPYLIEWCSGGPCYLVTPAGTITGATPAEDSLYDASRLTIVDRSAEPLSMGEALPIEPYLNTMEVFEKEAPTLLGSALESTAETPTRYADELRFTVRSGWTLLVSTQVSPEETLATLKSLWENSIPADKKGELQSIDLRVPGRAFIAYENASGSQPVADPNTGAPTFPSGKKSHN